ncbi:MAG: undecaprenyl-diphosphate phosphatase [Clostridia bacterium]|nr:undecaprenyl-diphosphate phosphatase [Clostridia bacterium]
MDFLEILKAILYGIVEGITEWLPISSTGHLILLDEIIPLSVSEEFLEMLIVVIQLGAILAVPCLFFDKLNPFSRAKTVEQRRGTLALWGKVIIGALPAGLVGVILEVFFDIPDHFAVVAAALIIFGVGFIIVERLGLGRNADGEFRVNSVYELSCTDALKIGAFQVLSLIPGASRSGTTTLGGMISGVSREVSAEFSFFMAIPIMIGASGLKLLSFIGDGFSLGANEIAILVIGIVVSFAVSLIAIKFLMGFVKRHSFTPFGIYRIILGIIVLSYFAVTLI